MVKVKVMYISTISMSQTSTDREDIVIGSKKKEACEISISRHLTLPYSNGRPYVDCEYLETGDR